VSPAGGATDELALLDGHDHGAPPDAVAPVVARFLSA
jgi:hypothetical protein